MDFLGEPVSLRYKGSSYHQSGCGSLCSLLVAFVILIYLANSIATVVFSAPGIVSQATYQRSDANVDDNRYFSVQMPEFRPFQDGFAIAVGFQPLKSYGKAPSFATASPMLGNLTFTYVQTD